ncbi:MAG: hypothetical protein SGJ15_03385 [Bacteroidota bacterium]|nr:hypothetical protein [Bacteroidota bacterium]
MIKNNLIRSVTLLSFIVLLSGFVAFKGGAFDNYLSANNSVYPDHQTTDMPIDSPTPKKNVQKKKKNPDMMYSSKSMVLTDQEFFIGDPKDSVQKKEVKQTSSKDSLKRSPK